MERAENDPAAAPPCARGAAHARNPGTLNPASRGRITKINAARARGSGPPNRSLALCVDSPSTGSFPHLAWTLATVLEDSFFLGMAGCLPVRRGNRVRQRGAGTGGGAAGQDRRMRARPARARGRAAAPRTARDRPQPRGNTLVEAGACRGRTCRSRESTHDRVGGLTAPRAPARGAGTAEQVGGLKGGEGGDGC